MNIPAQILSEIDRANADLIRARYKCRNIAAIAPAYVQQHLNEAALKCESAMIQLEYAMLALERDR